MDVARCALHVPELSSHCAMPSARSDDPKVKERNQRLGKIPRSIIIVSKAMTSEDLLFSYELPAVVVVAAMRCGCFEVSRRDQVSVANSVPRTLDNATCRAVREKKELTEHAHGVGAMFLLSLPWCFALRGRDALRWARREFHLRSTKQRSQESSKRRRGGVTYSSCAHEPCSCCRCPGVWC